MPRRPLHDRKNRLKGLFKHDFFARKNLIIHSNSNHLGIKLDKISFYNILPSNQIHGTLQDAEILVSQALCGVAGHQLARRTASLSVQSGRREGMALSPVQSE